MIRKSLLGLIASGAIWLFFQSMLADSGGYPTATINLIILGCEVLAGVSALFLIIGCIVALVRRMSFSARVERRAAFERAVIEKVQSK